MSVFVFETMLGKVMSDVIVNDDRDEMVFKSTDGKTFKFLHYQDCCESVSIEDVCGDLCDLVGSPLLVAEEVDNLDTTQPEESDDYSSTWTFYRFGTDKGTVTVRWLGTSNGYYSESVSFEEVCGKIE